MSEDFHPLHERVKRQAPALIDSRPSALLNDRSGNVVLQSETDVGRSRTAPALDSTNKVVADTTH